ncbi:MAG: hypothetical protein HYU84_12085 [Chloroflexi bacterium]|nr:hypothetical protein [Chloroflexota bacterium]MBI3168331.1 hypothetical protein [Chloroflexota bacterium]
MKHLTPFIFILMLVLQACGGSTATEAPSLPETQIAEVVATEASIPEPIVHVDVPSEGVEVRATAHDNEESTTSGNKDVIFGDDFASNRFERPFTANDMIYLPDLDIVDFSITSDDNFFYIRIDLADVDLASQSLTGFYGVEFDKNSDGRAEIFLVTRPPYNTEFTADNVFLFIDSNGDIGAEQAASPDAANGDGFESILFDLDNGIHPEDADLAWVRFIPDTKPAVEIAYKKWLFKDGNENFMWSVTANDSLIDPAQYNFHDVITEAEAGSPTKSNPNYPIKLLAAMDNTCRVPFGFQARGNEPLGCAINNVLPEPEEEIDFCTQFPSACERLPSPPPVDQFFDETKLKGLG